MAEGDLRQASEKMWEAAALAVKAIAYEREGLRLTSHGELWHFVSKLAAQTRDKELGRLWRSASSMHVNFYEGWANKEHVAEALEDVKAFVRKLKKA